MNTSTDDRKHKVEVYEEICCSKCNSIIHNHFDCPDCDASRPGTSIYSPIEIGDEFECQRCGTEYEVLSFRSARNASTATIKQLTRHSECPDCGNGVEWREGRSSVICTECFETHDTAGCDLE